MGCDQSEVEKNKDRHLPHDDVDIMVAINDVPSTVNAIAVVIPCILSLCILVLVYTIFQFKNKNVQQHVTYYKHPVQEWVWRTGGRDGPQTLENISEGYYAEVWPVPVFRTTLFPLETELYNKYCNFLAWAQRTKLLGTERLKLCPGLMLTRWSLNGRGTITPVWPRPSLSLLPES